MIVGVQGSRSFDDYAVFLRAMGTALSEMGQDDREIFIYSAGPARVNSMAMEFSNVSERSLKARGIKIQTRKVPVGWFQDYMSDIDFFAYFCKAGESDSALVGVAESVNKIPYVYRYA
jgi:hypothetical protein